MNTKSRTIWLALSVRNTNQQSIVQETSVSSVISHKTCLNLVYLSKVLHNVYVVIAGTLDIGLMILTTASST